MSDHGFRHFLACLSPDPVRSARRYTEVHVRLSRLFARHCCDEPRQLADETLDRAIRKVGTVALGGEAACEAYVLGIARRILLEQARARRRHLRRARDIERLLGAADVLPDVEQERRYACLEQCLDELHPEDRDLILLYYGQKGSRRSPERRTLADEARLSEVALRKRTQRIRQRLRLKLQTVEWTWT